MKRSVPMTRTGFAQKKFSPSAAAFPTCASVKPKVKPMCSLLRTADLPRMEKPRKRLKSKGPRMTPIRASARGEDCTLRLPGICNYDTSTTVLCHENGAGAGMKSPDECGAYGCYACHMVLDGHVPRPEGLTREMVQAAFVEGNRLTRLILERKGLLK